jgi:hypothetical protein
MEESELQTETDRVLGYESKARGLEDEALRNKIYFSDLKSNVICLLYSSQFLFYSNENVYPMTVQVLYFKSRLLILSFSSPQVEGNFSLKNPMSCPESYT